MTDFSAQLLGRTEKALNAILDRHLASIGITEPQWVALTLAVTGGGTATADALAGRIADALKVDAAAARVRVRELADLGLVGVDDDGGVVATDEGAARWRRVREAIGPITEQMWGDLPEADLTAAGRVLAVVLARANAVLAAHWTGAVPEVSEAPASRTRSARRWPAPQNQHRIAPLRGIDVRRC